MNLILWLKRKPKKISNIPMTRDEVSKHNKLSDCWIIINNDVYDITDFINYHPTNKKIFSVYAGKDATEMFYKVHPYVNYKEILKYEYKGYIINS